MAQNKIQENILIEQNIKKQSISSPIENAYNNISNYLIKNNENYITNNTIEESNKTMNFMWDVMEKSKSMNKRLAINGGEENN